MTTRQVIVLNSDYSPISLIKWQRAFNLLLKERAEIVEKSDVFVQNFEGNKSFNIPKVIKLTNFVKSVFKAQVSFTRKNILIRDFFICQYCGSEKDLTVDHVIPSSQGGKSNWDNCVASCKSCNHSKGNKSLKSCKFTLKNKPRKPTLTEYVKAKIYIAKIETKLFS